MHGAVEWRETKFEEVYDQEVRGLERRKKHDPSFGPDDIRAILKHLYFMEGSDWVGRGELHDISIQATIAAHEEVLFRWEKIEKKGN